MSNAIASINPVGVILAAFAVMMLGWLWFEKLFASAYVVVLGRGRLPKTKPGALFIAGPSLCMLVTALTSAVLIRALAIQTLRDVMAFGVVVGVGYLGATAVNMGINPSIPQPLRYGFLSASYFLIASVLIATILYLVG